MDVNMNINNMLNLTQNNLNSTKQIFGKDKISFSKMLATMITDKSAAQSLINNNNLENSVNLVNPDGTLNIMEVLAGSGGMGNLSLLNTNTVETDVTNIGNKDDKTKKLEEDILENLIGMQGYLNNSVSEVMSSHLNSDNSLETTNLDYRADMNFVNFNSQNFKYTTTDNEQDVHKPEVEIFKMESGNLKTMLEEKPIISAQAEKLITEIESKRDKMKNEINLHAEMLTNNKQLTSEQNEIINISDESTQIKSQVLSQIKDKIVIMAEEGLESGNTVKHVTMELHPNNLGKVDIKMTIVNNKLTVEVNALNEETQKIIASSVDELASMLSKTSETLKIVVKSTDSSNEHQQINYYTREDNLEQKFNQDNKNYDQGRQKNHYYYDDEKGQESDNDGVFSELINLRNIRLNL